MRKDSPGGAPYEKRKPAHTIGSEIRIARPSVGRRWRSASFTAAIGGRAAARYQISASAAAAGKNTIIEYLDRKQNAEAAPNHAARGTSGRSIQSMPVRNMAPSEAVSAISVVA